MCEEEQKILDLIKAIREIASTLDCGDNSCYFAPRPLRGMRTNGGCRCINNHRAERLIKYAPMLADVCEQFLKNCKMREDTNV